jgi:hypothetical protein
MTVDGEQLSGSLSRAHDPRAVAEAAVRRLDDQLARIRRLHEEALPGRGVKLTAVPRGAWQHFFQVVVNGAGDGGLPREYHRRARN